MPSKPLYSNVSINDYSQHTTCEIRKTLNALQATYQGDKSPGRLVVQEFKTVAFQVEDGPNQHKQKGECKSAGVVWWSKYSHLRTATSTVAM